MVWKNGEFALDKRTRDMVQMNTFEGRPADAGGKRGRASAPSWSLTSDYPVGGAGSLEASAAVVEVRLRSRWQRVHLAERDDYGGRWQRVHLAERDDYGAAGDGFISRSEMTTEPAIFEARRRLIYAQ